MAKTGLGYLKKVVEKMKEQGADDAAIKKFQTSVSNYYTKTIGPQFKDYDFYVGESMDTDGMYVSRRFQMEVPLTELPT